jgi:hypothetical protein
MLAATFECLVGEFGAAVRGFESARQREALPQATYPKPSQPSPLIALRKYQKVGPTPFPCTQTRLAPWIRSVVFCSLGSIMPPSILTCSLGSILPPSILTFPLWSLLPPSILVRTPAVPVGQPLVQVLGLLQYWSGRLQ